MCLRQVILALVLLPLSLQAQLFPITNLHQVFGLGFKVGDTNIYDREGEFKWDPVNKILLFHNGTSWAPVLSGTAAGYSISNLTTVSAITGVFDTVILGGGNLEEALFPLKNDADAGGNSVTNVNMLEALSLKFDGGTGTLNNIVLDFARVDSGSATLSAIEFLSGTGLLDTVSILSGTGVLQNATVTDLIATNATVHSASILSGTGYFNTIYVESGTSVFQNVTSDYVSATLDLTSFGTLNVYGETVLNDYLTYLGTNALTKAYLMHDGSNLVYQYAPREIWTATRFAQAITSNEFVYPGQQLLWPNIINFQQRDDMFQLKQTISPLVYTNADYPTPNNAAFWDLVLRQGRDGSQGIPGKNGSANIFYQGIWSSSNANFTFSPTSYTWVSYQGQIYNLLSNSVASDVPDVSPSNWQVIVSRGTDAIVTTVSNLVDRGVWNSYTSYTNLDLVIYAGNTFYVDPTNAPPGTNRVPSVNSDSIGQDNAYWTVRTSRGVRGLQGLKGLDGVDGEDGAVTQTFITNIFNTFTDIIFDTNDFRFVNSPNPTNRIPAFLQSTNGTNQYVWADYTPVGTNNLTVSNNLLYLNGELASGSARLTSAWSVVYSDGNTNSVSLPLGASNTVLRSTGPASDPVWAVLDDLSWKTQPVSANYTSVSYNFVLADTTSSDIFITLPSASVNSGKVVAARKMVNDNTLFVKTEPGDLVQGVGTVGVVRAGSVIEVISTGGTDWWLK